MSTDPNFLWLGEKHKEALATLKYAIVENKGILALTGDVGTGKTTLINALIQSLGDDTMVATIYDPSLQVLDFFNIVSVAFNMGRTFDGKGEFLIYFKQFLKEARARNKKALLIIDEAQRISSELLEEIRLLSNLEDEHVRLLNIFFVGQNEFIDILKEYKNRALRQRITIRYHIEPLTLSETKTYTQHRLKTAGARAPIFSPGAIQEIFSFSKGYPRMINIICDHALLSGFVREIIIINADIIRECKEELKISDLNRMRDTDRFNDERASKPEIPVIQRQERPKKKDIRLKSVFIGIGLLAVIGSVTGYVFYNDIKTGSLVNLILNQDNTSYPEKWEEKNNLQTTNPNVPKEKTYPVPSKVEIGKVGDSRYYIIKDPEPKLFREVDISKEKTPASVPSEAIAGQADTQEIPGGDREPEVYDAFTKMVPKESKIPEITPEETKSTPPKAKPVTVQKETLDKDRVEPAPSEKPASRTMTGFSDSGPTPRVAAVSEKDKQPIKTAAIRESATARVAVPAKKSQEKKVVIPAKKPEEKKAVVPVKKIEIKEATFPANKPEEKKVVVPRKKFEEKKVVVPVKKTEEKKVVALRKGIKPEGVAGDRFVRTDLQSRLNAFLKEYCQTYAKEQLNKFAAFFTPDAMEKGKSFTSRLGQYRRTFARIDAMDYRIDLKRYAIQEGTGVIRIEGIFYVKARLDGSATWRERNGPIDMELLANGDSFKVRRLDY
ncbi:MAG: AAA family ATPase [Deltaproteobacteria bacterium]|nr:AAA family ATPase [Deltaproteobacteria bacterium]